MPAGFPPKEGIGALLSYMLSADITGVLPWEMLFWVNDFVPDEDTVFADLQEATWSGYVRLTMDRDLWVITVSSDGVAHGTWGTEAVQWNVNGGPLETPYGVAYLDTSSGLLRFVQRFDSADIAPVVVGQPVSVLPQFTLNRE